VAVQSKFLAVDVAVPWARDGVGAIATQAWANLSYGPRGLDLLAQGLSAAEVKEKALLEATQRKVDDLTSAYRKPEVDPDTLARMARSSREHGETC